MGSAAYAQEEPEVPANTTTSDPAEEPAELQEDDAEMGSPAELEGESESVVIEPDMAEGEMPGDELVNLNLNKQDVSEIIEFIVRWTGKVVIVQEQAILSRKITVMSE